MTAVPHRKVDRHQIYKEIALLIENSADGEVEISSSDLADKFGVQAPTMDYHLNKLVEDNMIAVSPKRGRYNRKVYRLPGNVRKGTVIVPTANTESNEQFQAFLQRHLESSKNNQETSEAVQETDKGIQEELLLEQPTGQVDLIVDDVQFQVKAPAPVVEDKVETPVQEKEMPKETPKVEFLDMKELTLDEKIQLFLKESNEIYGADELLRHEDREIISVINQTLQETQVYLKDLSEQLSTIQNKQLIVGLIEDRNRMQKEMERLRKEADEARAQADKTIQQFKVDPSRVRFMQQLVISTIDNYVNQPNHALALGRNAFRDKVQKEVSDLAKYILQIER